jgi:hypothetical protein
MEKNRDMGNNNWTDYKIRIRERFKLFSPWILELSELFSTTKRANVLNYQMTKSGTSVYANYRAALRARSKAEFFSKLNVIVEIIKILASMRRELNWPKTYPFQS